MDIKPSTFSNAIERTSLLFVVVDVLAKLRPNERVQFVADALAIAERTEKAETAPSAATSARPANGRKPHAQAAPEPQPTVGDESVGPTAKIIETLTAHPKMPLRALTKIVYGTDDDTAYRNLRSILAALHKQKRVKPGKLRGQWEVVS